MDKPTLKGVCRRIERALLALYLSAQGPAVDPTRDQIDSGKPSSQKPPDFGSEYDEWLSRAASLAQDIEQIVKGGSHTRPSRADLRSRIHQYEGRDPVFVAYHERCSVETVRKARSDVGLEAGTGFRRPRPITSRDVPESLGQNQSSPRDTIAVSGGFTPSDAMGGGNGA